MYPPKATQFHGEGIKRAWDAGRNGRALLDRVCRQAPDHLRGGGALLVVHSSICGEDRTRRLLEEGGLAVGVMARRRGALGPLMAERVATLERRGLVDAGQRDEEILVIRARKALT